MIPKYRTLIRRMAAERGMSMAEIARRLHLYRSNLSNVDAGRRTLSLEMLSRISEALGCDVSDLVENRTEMQTAIFRRRKTERLLQEKEQATSSGMEVGWVNRALLNWQRHYRTARRSSRKP